MILGCEVPSEHKAFSEEPAQELLWEVQLRGSEVEDSEQPVGLKRQVSKRRGGFF